MVVLLGCAGLAAIDGLLNPAVFGLAECVPLAICKPAIDPYPEGIMPSSGVVALLRD